MKHTDKEFFKKLIISIALSKKELIWILIWNKIRYWFVRLTETPQNRKKRRELRDNCIRDLAEFCARNGVSFLKGLDAVEHITCDGCIATYRIGSKKYGCDCAYDSYNTYGDCLRMK